MAMNLREIESLVVQRAWKDEVFRAEFLANAKGTIEKYAGQKLPSELKVVALAEDDRTIHFVIPPKPANADELSDEDLEKVAGGVDVLSGIVVATIVTIAVVGTAAEGTMKNHGW